VTDRRRPQFYEPGGVTYLLTANEGDAREYTGLTDVSRVRDLRDVVLERTGVRPSRADALCAADFPERDAVVDVDELGRLNVSTIDGWDPDRGCFFGRRFTSGIWASRAVNAEVNRGDDSLGWSEFPPVVDVAEWLSLTAKGFIERLGDVVVAARRQPKPG
jgi:hypothetical protein